MMIFIKTLKVDGYEYDVLAHSEYGAAAPFFYDYYEVVDGAGFRITDEVFLTEPSEADIEEFLY
jgi:hypothetical protein